MKLIDITGKAISGEWGNDCEDGNGIPVLRTTNFTDTGVINFANVVLRDIPTKDLSKKFLRPGDIIIEKSGGSDTKPVGRVVYFDSEENKYLINNFTGLLRVVDQTKWYPRYVFYALFANYSFGGTRQYENKTTGLHNLKLDQYLNSFDIPDVDFQLQHHIADTLDKVSEGIALCRKMLGELDLMVKAKFVEMFGDPVSNPMGWEEKKLGHVCKKLTDGTHFSPESFATGAYKYVTAKNIRINGFDFSNITYIPEEVHRPIYERCNPEYGDVLYIKDGVTTGIAMVNTLHEEFSLLSSVALLKQDRNVINGCFLCGVLNNAEMYSNIRMNMGGAAITRLTIAKLNEIRVIVPPIELQEQFATFVSKIDKSRLTIQQVLSKMEMVKLALMQEYFG